MQLAYVPKDLNASLNYWTQTMGVGPFFRISHAQTMVEQISFRGAPCEADFTIYLSYWGDIQIELFEQHNGAPSPYSEWLDQAREGVHHVCVEVRDLDAARTLALSQGAQVIFEVKSCELDLAYFDTDGGAASIVEVMQPKRDNSNYQAHMKQCVRAWGGKDPIREFGE